MNNLTSIAWQYLESIACCDFQKLKQLLHQKYTYTNTDGQLNEGPDMRFDTAGLTLNAFPDLSFELKNSYQSGNVVVTEFIMRGTSQGEMRGISAADSQMTIPACSIVEIQDGLILSEREYFDKGYLFRQTNIIDSSEQKARILA